LDNDINSEDTMNKPLSELTDEELKAELQRRADTAKQAKKAARTAQVQLLIQHREALLALIPHGRTSCSEERPINGFSYSGQPRPPRCARCALLELSEYHAETFDTDLTLNFYPVETKS
jgi:hypothetical protein